MRSDQPEVEYESVRILRLQPGDVVVVRLADRMDKHTAETIRNDLKPKFPDHEVLILGPNADLEIVDVDMVPKDWRGLMAILDDIYPESTFPTAPDHDGRDAGPRIVSLLRQLAEAQEL
jgi:hypothetical protein